LSHAWYKTYQKLEAFIKNQPEVQIKENFVSIDEKVRPAFYKLFNNVRTSFLGEKFSTWLDEAEFLSTKYMKVEDDLIERLRLKHVLMPLELRRSLSDPIKQIIREMFDPLFELLQKKIEMEEFEEKALERIGVVSRGLYQKGYIKWFIVSLIKKLDPEKIYGIPIFQPSSKEIIKHRKDTLQTIPFSEETDILGFEVVRRDIVLVPDFIVFSKLLGKYVGFRTEVGKAVWEASHHSDKREWFSIGSMMQDYGIVNMSPDLLLYVADNQEDISLVADSKKFCRPDMMIEFLDQAEERDAAQVDDFNRIRLYHDILKPVKGTCIISKHSLPEKMKQGLDDNILPIHFGFNNLKWDTVLTLLKQ